jgi:hypothetical protein
MEGAPGFSMRPSLFFPTRFPSRDDAGHRQSISIEPRCHLQLFFDSKEAIIEAIANERHAKERMLMSVAKKEATVVKVLLRIRDGFFSELRNPKEPAPARSIQLWFAAKPEDSQAGPPLRGGAAEAAERHTL